MPAKNRELLAGHIARELFENMASIDHKQLDLFDELLFAMLEQKEKATLDTVRKLKANQRLITDIHQALSVGDVAKALKLIGMDKS
jgi:hypothetical protein